MALRIRQLTDPDELETYHRLTSAAFGKAFDPAAFEAQRPNMHLDRAVVAELDGILCGAASSLPVELTVPGGTTLPAAAVTDVGVLPTQRRRGVARTLLAHQLADLRDRGDAVAVLHASEAGIYERYGYGAATRWRAVRLDARRVRFRPDRPAPSGSYRSVRRDDPTTKEACAAVHETARRLHPGGLSRTDAWWDVVFGDAHTYQGGGTAQQVVLHLDDAGRVDGYVIYQVTEDWSSGQAEHELEVWELVGIDASVEVGLWQVMCEHDLVARVVGVVAVDHALFDVVTDGRQARTTWDQDLLWLRLLDVATALSHRTYATDGTLVLQVVDPILEDQAGAYRLTVADGVATCARTTDPADLVLDTAELASAYLGGNSFRRLLRAGRIDERTPGAAAVADERFSVWPLPWCWVRF